MVVNSLLAAYEGARDEAVAAKLGELTRSERQKPSNRAVGILNVFDRNFVAANDEKRHLPTVYRALLEHDLVPFEPEDVARFAERNEFFGALSADDKQKVFGNLRPL